MVTIGQMERELEYARQDLSRIKEAYKLGIFTEEEKNEKSLIIINKTRRALGFTPLSELTTFDGETF